ncbi:MAG: DMT family transporter [Negativicutes bacterium]
MTKNSTLFSLLCVLAAAMLWGTTGTIQGLLPSSRNPVVVAAVRVLLGATALWLFCLVNGVSIKVLLGLPRWRICGAGTAIAGYNLFFFAGVAHAGVGVGTAIAIGSGPLWVLAYEIIFSARRPSSRSLTGQATAIAGLAILVMGDMQGQVSFLGYALSLLAGLSYGTYVYLTGGISKETNSALVAATTFSVASIVLSPSLFLFSTAWIDYRSFGYLAFLGIASTGVAFFLFTYGLQRISASTAVTLTLAEPLTAWFLATTILGEPVTLPKVIGAILLVVGIRIVAGASKSPE